MKIHRPLIPCLVGVMTLAGLSVPVHGAVTLPASAALPANSVSNPGFVVRTAQASTNFVIPSSFIRASRQINGLLTDTTGTVIPNVAIPGTNAGGAYFTTVVDFEKDSANVDIVDATSTYVMTFASEFFPGIPGTEGDTTQFADESVALVQLDAGVHTLAISTAADRTDVNDDDGYSIFVGANPRDYFATKIAEFQRAGAAGFTSLQTVENLVDVVVPVSGVYPFRILHWQGGRGSSLHFYNLDTNTMVRALINDPNDPSAPRAYRNSTVAVYNAPYIADIAPVPGSAGNASAVPLVITLIDGTTTVNTGTVQLSLNGTPVSPQTLSKVGNTTTVKFTPSGNWTAANNQVRLVYADSASASHTNTWSFGVNLAGSSNTQVTGQWDFDFGNLSPTVGTALQYLDPTFDGPAGSSANKTAFGTTTSFGIPNINGQIANVMQVPGDLDRRIGYVMHHGIAPNGGGTLVNQYTLIMDVMVNDTGAGAASLLNIGASVNNTDDGDLFWQGNNFGQGTGGYNGTGAFTPLVWHRVVAAYDEAANPPVVTKFVDGIKQDDWTANQGLDNPRRSLQPTAILFGDGDQDERRMMWVNSIQIRAGKLSDAEMVALGGPAACGIPANIPQSTVSGQWDFERGNLSATIGKPLQYIDPSYDNGGAQPTPGTNANQTAFGTCSALGVGLINGVDANIMQVPGDTGPGSRNLGYIMTHGIAPNGGGTLVNQYTLIMDVMINDTGAGAASLLNVGASLDNTDDGDLFWQGNNFGQGTGGYNGTGAFTPLVWHRVVAAYDEAATPPVVTKYVDGIKQDDWTANQGLDNPRRALQPTAILFGDGDQDERRTIWVKSIQIRAGKLSDAECALLGGPTGSAIPVVLPASTVSGQWDFNSGNLAATIGKPLQYIDPSYDNGGALPTPGTNANQTAFGTCSNLGIALINGVDANIVQVPGDTGPGSRSLGYIMTHGIAPNGGGTLVNQYTLIMDVLVDTTGAGAASLLNVGASVNNTDDGDLFWQGNNFGQGTGGYNGTGAFTPGEWHRVAAAYNEAATPPVVTKYVDGIFQDDWTANQGLDNPRRALQPTAILFGDGDQDERRTMWVNSIQIRAGALSKAELAALGAPTASGIPVYIPVEPAVSLCYGKIGNELTLIWPPDATGYTLTSAPSVSSASWTPVPGVVSNSVVVTIGPGNQFFRLEK